MTRADFISHFRCESLKFSCEKPETEGSITVVMLTTGSGFVADKLMLVAGNGDMK